MRPRVTVREQVHSGTQELVKYHDPLPDLEPGVYELVPVCADCNGTGEGEAVIGGERVEPGSDGWRMVQKRVLCPSCSQKDEQ